MVKAPTTKADHLSLVPRTDLTSCHLMSTSMHFLFEKVNLKAVPFGKDVSHHRVHQPLLSAKYKNTHISDFLTINTESCIPQEKAPKLVT